jgi:hypothetical protein
VLGWGKWSAIGDAAQRVIDADTWNALANTAAELVRPYPLVVAVDRSPVSQIWTIAGAQRTPTGIHVEIAWSAKASATEAVNRLVDIVGECDPSAVLISQGSPAAVLRGYLEAAGIDAEMINSSDMAIAAEAFVDAVDSARISHSGQQILSDSALAGIRKPLTGGRFVWDSSAGSAPLCHLIAATMAYWSAVQTRPPKRRPPAPMADTDDTAPHGGKFLDLDRVPF